MQQAPLRPLPRTWTALAIGVALVATFFARTERPNASAPSLVSVADALAPRAHAGVVAALVPASGRLTATIYDLAGTRVRVLTDGEPCARGDARLAWDGKDELGRPAPAGSYALKLEVRGARIRAQRVTRVRWPAARGT